MTQAQLENNLAMIKTELESELQNTTVIGLVEEKLLRLSNVMGLSAECMRYAKQYAANKQAVLLRDEKGYVGVENMSATVLKLWLEGELANELSILMYADRLNAALVHCADQLRTMISKYKVELEMEKYTRNSQP